MFGIGVEVWSGAMGVDGTELEDILLLLTAPVSSPKEELAIILSEGSISWMSSPRMESSVRPLFLLSEVSIMSSSPLSDG